MLLQTLTTAGLLLSAVATTPESTVACTNGSCGWELVLEVQTGAYDLPGGADNLDVTVTYHARPPQRALNVNGGRHWGAESTRTLLIPLWESLRAEEIAGIEFRTGWGGDWEVDGLVVVARGEGVEEKLYSGSGAPLFRFTDERRSFAARVD